MLLQEKKVLFMKKKIVYLIAFLLVMTVGAVVCLSFEGKSKNAVFTKDMEHLISKEDTERLRKIFANNDAWYECEQEAVYYGKMYEIEFDGMWYRVDTTIEGNPVYYGKVGKELTGLMNTDDIDLKQELIQIVNRWRGRMCSYEYLYSLYAKHEEQALLVVSHRGEEDNYTLSIEETAALRELLSLESGWKDAKEEKYNSRDYTVVLDNIVYSINPNDLRCDIHCKGVGEVYGSVITNANITIVSDVYDILKVYGP